MPVMRAVVFALCALALIVPGAADAGKKDDTLVWATDRENPIVDPYYLNTRELVVIGHYVYDTLVYIDPRGGEIKPVLATGWKWVSNTVLEMDLRTGVRFHDGSDLTADDVVYTLNFISKPENAIVNLSLVSFIASAEKIDSHKVRINLKRPFPPALAYLAGIAFILKKGHYDGAPAKADGKKDFGAVKANGTGPYMVTEVKPGESITAVKNPNYFKGGYKSAPQVGKIVFRTIKDENTRLAELMTGRIDWVWDVPKDQAERLKANPALVIDNAKTLRFAYLQFDVRGTSGTKFFTDKRVRQAVAHAINREAIAKNLVGPASEVIHAACHPDQFACSRNVPKYDYDPAKAKQLLAEAGFPNGVEVELFGYRERPFTEAVIGDLAKVGIKTKLTWLQYSALIQVVHKGQTPINHMTWGSNSIPDVAAAAGQFFKGGPDDTAKDPELIKILEEADSLIDPERRKAAWEKGLQRITGEAYWVPLYTYAKYYAWSKELDFAATSDEIPPFYAVKWK